MMQAYEFRREREVAVTLRQDGSNLPGGMIWEPSAVIDARDLRDDVAGVLDEVGFFVWA